VSVASRFLQHHHLHPRLAEEEEVDLVEEVLVDPGEGEDLAGEEVPDLEDEGFVEGRRQAKE